MASNAMFAEVAALAGDPARWNILTALIDGRALTASELARVAGVSSQTASGHLGRLAGAELVRVERQGRHRYHRLASPAVARMLEGIMQVVAERDDAARPKLVTGPRDAALRFARTCYDHLAGRLAVDLADSLTAAGHVELSSDGGLITDSGVALFERIGMRVGGAPRGRRVLCRPCLDWSERRPHLAGVLGTALCNHLVAAGWIRRSPGTRAVTVTREGERRLRDHFGVVAQDGRGV